MKAFWRALWFIPFFAINTVFYGLVSVLVSFGSAKAARGFGPSWAKLNLWAVRVPLIVEGLELLPKDGGGVVIASNHASAADIAAILAGLPLDICWVTKESLLRIPFFGWHLRRVHIPVARRAGRNTERLLAEGAEKIKDGAAVVVFPEGTRNRNPGELLPFKKGAFLLGHAAARPIVPVAILNSYKIWPPGTLVPGSGTLHMRIGPPIDPSRYGPEDLPTLAADTRQAIAGMLANG